MVEFSYVPSHNTIYCEGQSPICGELFAGDGSTCRFTDCNNHSWNVFCFMEEAEDLFNNDMPVMAVPDDGEEGF